MDRPRIFVCDARRRSEERKERRKGGREKGRKEGSVVTGRTPDFFRTCYIC